MSKLILNPEYGLYERNGQAFCSSRQVAEEFGKRHADVLRSIEQITAPTSGVSTNFTGELDKMKGDVNVDQLQIIQHNGRLLEGSKVTAKEFFGSMYDSYLNLHKAKELKNFYVIGFPDGLVKIGVSKSPKQRISTIQKQSGRHASNIHISLPMESLVAYELETLIKRKYRDKNTNGEFYDVEFQNILNDVIAIGNGMGGSL